ncbi:aminotransferase-like domain-containing protein [Falsibacillus albus]|uniref:PLP-dependent aminotransferase family protein n=1 Tax=Falsibacillus albus TaxID=2478915 RepID=A0A3L7JWA3_9BACI|nr:PLP-dependent aminotransferase family protein [Falsibacillus albus]RLQ94534.1 PLP-dependent aminotransferase family protein [Falsibacillus albus]
MIDQYGNEINWFPKLRDDGIPKYKQIAQSIEDDINNGVLKPGSVLPPQRVLANFLGVNHSTVTRAFKNCESKGLIKGTVGKGTFVSIDAGIPQDLLSSNAQYIIDMGMVYPLYEVNDLIESYLKEIYENIDHASFLKYIPPEGIAKHRYIGAQWVKTLGVECSPEQVIITSGTQNALSIILATLFEKGDKIIVDQYTYSGFKNISLLFGITLIPIKMTEDGMGIDELESMCKREQIKGIYMTPDNHNPTSITLSEAHREKVAKIIGKYNLLFIEDGEFTFSIEGKYRPISAYVPENSLYIAGTSKSISPAFRISYMVSPLPYVKKLTFGLNNLTWMASPLNAEMISQLIQLNYYDHIIETKLAIIRERNLLVDEVLGGYDITGSDTSFFRFLKLPGRLTGKEVEMKCLEQGVQVFCAERFLVHTQAANHAVRLSVSGPQTLEDVKKGLVILKNVLEQLSTESETII